MTEFLSERRAELEGKDKAEVFALLGQPAAVSRWKNVPPPTNVTPAELTDFEETSLADIWVYRNGRVHFSIAGKVLKVDDKYENDLPPPEGMVFA